MPSVDDTTRGAFRDASEPTEGDSLPPGDGGDRLGPLLGSLPPDVFREVLLPILDELSRACFALSAGACFRAVKDAGLSWKLNACFLAAYSGDLGQLRYAHEHGCPWNESGRALLLHAEATWSACSTRTSTTAPGTSGRAMVLQAKAI